MKPDLRTALHVVADALADALEERAVDTSNEQSDVSPGPLPSKRKRGRRRAPRMPPVIRSELDVSPDNRERARQALLRRGFAVPTKTE